ncbi:hypothetical protein GKZ90_0001175 [Flavobacterium sp. MC2016-06]|uniref:hypothetical protein n=1 Tax=Flavobacterium sp. MC2016-06 TaxID=2676308 RepID=UPI0012BA57E8|nr:hypothetical protein [Flavobacterium sp. MC2016-06]MBU3859077.1 hypothetical protein [Flavobacterium sp. MC2016-06]
MKKNLLILAIAVSLTAIMAFSGLDNKSVGAIGDVKYSVLIPDKFREENGDGWVQMDDKIPLQGSELNIKHGITSVPDVRGLFIRSLNGSRNDDKRDMFNTENNRDRLVLEYQPDAIKKHTHNLSNKLGFFCGWTTGNQWSGGQRGNPMSANDPECSITILESGTNLSGDETRPKNISLYTYIKINE